jgi:hypothetical protein
MSQLEVLMQFRDDRGRVSRRIVSELIVGLLSDSMLSNDMKFTFGEMSDVALRRVLENMANRVEVLLADVRGYG